MLEFSLLVATIILSAAIVIGLYRVWKGPSMPDRVLALDMIGIKLIGIIALVSIMFETTAFMEVMLLLGILAFIGTVAFSKFLEKGVVIERKRDQ